MLPLQKQSYPIDIDKVDWFIPDETLTVDSDVYIPSELENDDDWYIRCAEAWELNILERENLNKKKLELKLINLPYPPPTIYTSPYVISTKGNDNVIEILDISSDTEGYLPLIKDEKLDTFPTFFRNIKMILIPKKTQRILQRASRSRLKNIDSNIDIAIEKCLLIISNLSDTIYLKSHFSKKDRWKSLNSKILHNQTGKNQKYIYLKIITLLKDLEIIEVLRNPDERETYQPGVISKQYRLTEEIFNAGLTQYTILEEEIIQSRRNIERGKISENKDNIIVKNILEVRKHLLIPTLKLVLNTGIKLTKQKGGYSKKGKKLIYLNKRSRNNFDSKKFMFVEDHIKLYKTLFDSLSYPKVGSTNSGYRVTSFLNLIPSWIRKLFKIDGEETVEPDIVTFHPNIANFIYGGSGVHTNHDLVAEYLGINRSMAKEEHLSFFNKHPNQMVESCLYDNYMKKEPDMMNNLLEEKSKYGYKITSKNLLLKETKVIIYAIELLNKENIFVGYIFDGLLCKKSDSEKVKQVIDKALKHHDINTYSKI